MTSEGASLQQMCKHNSPCTSVTMLHTSIHPSLHFCRCSSYVGRIGRMQEVSIGIKRCKSPGNAAHELGHALGFWHEHTRSDRNRYIRVHYDNIKSDYTNNFVTSNHDGVPDVGYDYESIMHYEEDAFTRQDGLKTIEIRENVTIPDCMLKMGQRRRLSYKDQLRMSSLYNCTGENGFLLYNGLLL